MPQFFLKPNYDFIKVRWPFLMVSIVIILAGLVTLAIRGPNYSIDFRGGLDIHLRFEKLITEGEVRSALSPLDLGVAEVKRVHSLGEPDEILIRIKQSEVSSDLITRIESTLAEAFPENPFEVRNVDAVGPKVGRELRQQAIISALVALVLLLIYISWRFEFKFAVGGIVALFHDVLITLGFFAFFNYEISLQVVAAFLTLIGFSINDTIVVYDRIRENMKKLRSISLAEIMNLSINETLSRTVITSLTVFLVVLVLFIFAGPVVRGFAFAMLVGVITGVYSSVFIAAPVVLEWAQRTAIKGKKKR
ncbi:protein translocase subunit SecF [bacterium]|nr:protein translocase subunit SecF [bacterium]MBU1935972.1 protein translocase subunit SecF [bacterium]